MEFELYFVLYFFIIADVVVCSTNEKCIDYAKNVNYHHPLLNYEAPKPHGDWVSSRCEITPEKNYIFRYIKIALNDWTGYIYHYSDSWCTQPTFTVKITGAYDMLPSTATPNSKASFSTNFRFTKITVRTDNSAVLERILNMIMSKCPKALPKIAQMQINDKVNLDAYINTDVALESHVLTKKRCRYFFGLHSYAYKKIRITGDKTKTTRFTQYILEKYDTLYFGNIPPVHVRAHDYEGLEFQYGLSRLDRPGCSICAVMQKHKNKDVVPTLPMPKHRNYITGEWVSQVCEAGDDTTYLTRYYKILSNKTGGSITIHENSFTDPNCKEKQAEVRSKGFFVFVKPDKIQDVLELRITYTSAYLSIYDEAYLNVLRAGSRCGDAEKWQRGVEQDITKTNGCAEIGLALPDTKIAVVRAYRYAADAELYFDQRKLAEKGGTYFTKNLVSCASITSNITKKTTATLGPFRTKILMTVAPDIPTEKVKENNKSSGLRLQGNILTFLYAILFLTILL